MEHEFYDIASSICIVAYKLSLVRVMTRITIAVVAEGVMNTQMEPLLNVRKISHNIGWRTK